MNKDTLWFHVVRGLAICLNPTLKNLFKSLLFPGLAQIRKSINYSCAFTMRQSNSLLKKFSQQLFRVGVMENKQKGYQKKLQYHKEGVYDDDENNKAIPQRCRSFIYLLIGFICLIL